MNKHFSYILLFEKLSLCNYLEMLDFFVEKLLKNIAFFEVFLTLSLAN